MLKKSLKRCACFDPSNKVWLPLERDPNGPKLDDIEPVEGYAWCGWETPNGQKWGAIWRYKYHESNYLTFLGQSRNFIAPDTFSSLTVSAGVLYRFSLSSGSAYLNTVSGSVTKTVSGGKVRFSIPNVTENPIFIKFSN